MLNILMFQQPIYLISFPSLVAESDRVAVVRQAKRSPNRFKTFSIAWFLVSFAPESSTAAYVYVPRSSASLAAKFSIQTQLVCDKFALICSHRRLMGFEEQRWGGRQERKEKKFISRFDTC